MGLCVHVLLMVCICACNTNGCICTCNTNGIYVHVILLGVYVHVILIGIYTFNSNGCVYMYVHVTLMVVQCMCTCNTNGCVYNTQPQWLH